MSCTPQMVSMERKTRVTVHTNVPHAEPPNRFPRHPLDVMRVGMPPRLDPFKKQPRKFVLLADMLPRGLALVLICIAVFCVCLILVGLGG